jgi:hypothetical protein
MMLAMEALPKGGRISVIPGEESTTHVIAEGENAGLRDNTEDALARKIAVDALDPRLVHPYVIGMISELYGFSISIHETGENKVTFAIQSPSAD